MTDITKPVEKRPYRQEKRAAASAETRQRIVAAALELHGSVGPGRTTVSQIAAKAGVQRHTYYAHFPDERSLFEACSGLHLERDPMPDPMPWREIVKPRKRLKAGLGAVYGWFGRNAGLLAMVLADAEHHDLTRETVTQRFGPVLAGYRNVLGEGLNPRQQVLIHLALGFPTWRSLVAESGLREDDAIDAMTDAVLGKK